MARATRDSHFLFFNSRKSFRQSNKLPLNSLSSLLPSPSNRRRTLVSTVLVKYVPPAPDFDFSKEITRLRILRSKLSNSKSLRDKIYVVDSDSMVKRFFRKGNRKYGFSRVLDSLYLDEYELYLLKCIVAAGQEHLLIGSGYDTDFSVDGEFESARASLKSALYTLVEMIGKWDGNDDREIKADNVALRSLLITLRNVEEFYDCIGGIIGYQLMILELLSQSVHGENIVTFHHVSKSKSMGCKFEEIHLPRVLDLSQDTKYAARAALWGIDA